MIEKMVRNWKGAAGLLVFSAGCATALLSAESSSAVPFAIEATVPVPGEGGGEFDHFTVDVDGHRLFVADEGPAPVYVFDTHTNQGITLLGKGFIHSPHSLTSPPHITPLYVVAQDSK